MCLFQNPNPKKARQIHIKRGNLKGVMQGELNFDEATLKRDATVALEPDMTYNDNGEEVRAEGEPEEI